MAGVKRVEENTGVREGASELKIDGEENAEGKDEKSEQWKRGTKLKVEENQEEKEAKRMREKRNK